MYERHLFLVGEILKLKMRGKRYDKRNVSFIRSIDFQEKEGEQSFFREQSRAKEVAEREEERSDQQI